MNKGALLDRDGTLNKDNGYVFKLEDFKLLRGVLRALKTLQKHDYKLIIITNQSGIGRGYYTEEEFQTLTTYMIEDFKKRRITIEKVYHCPHKPEDNCNCRKPKPKLALEAIVEFDLDPKHSWYIGDKPTDSKMGENAGLRSILIESKYSKDFKFEPKVKGLKEAVQYILKNE